MAAGGLTIRRVMWKYVRRAFFATVPIPLVGRVPLNAIFVAAAAAAGLRYRAVWVFAAWLEAAYLLLLSSNARFQKVVDAEELAAAAADPELQRRRLAEQLTPGARERQASLERRCDRAVELARQNGVEEFVLQSNVDALRRLSWLHLKLLLARQALNLPEKQALPDALRAQAAELDRELADPSLPESVREAKRETRRILERRIELLDRRGLAMQQVEADLDRIEAEVDLAVEHATLGPGAANAAAPAGEVRLTTALLESELFGDQQNTVEALDRLYEK